MKVAQAMPPASLFNGSRAVPASPISSFDGAITARGPFQGLIICVTGLSKDARKQVQEATMRMGGQYSPDLHPRCTHLVVQSFGGRKYEHALKHGLSRGLFVVTLAWFVTCVRQNERLEESLYSVKDLVNVRAPLEDMSHTLRIAKGEHSCLPSISQQESKTYNLAICSPSLPLLKELVKPQGALFSGMRFFIDLDSSNELRTKVVEVVAKEGASFIDHWFIGSEATHVVCEGSQILKYLGFNVNLITPLWVVKSVRERHLQRLVQISTDLARHISILLDSTQNGHVLKDDCNHHGRNFLAQGHDEGDLQAQIREREEKANAAKACVRRRRGPRMQPCRTIPRPITPSILLESVCWSITDPPSTAHFYSNSSGGSLNDDGVDNEISERGGFLFDVCEDRHTLGGIPEDSTYTQPMSESETKEVVFKAPFLTILFPIDRFAEIGLSSKTFYSEKGFERQQILEFVWAFYQEYMTTGEVEVAMYSDSKHADKLRAVYADKESIELGYVPMRRCDFLGSRKSFEGLKRVGRENTSQIYELCLGA